MTTNLLAQSRDRATIKYYVEIENSFGTIEKKYYTLDNVRCMIQQTSSTDNTNVIAVPVTMYKVFFKRNVIDKMPNDFHVTVDTIIWHYDEKTDIVLEPITDLNNRRTHFFSNVKHVTVMCKKLNHE